jgi:hypothetical protein
MYFCNSREGTHTTDCIYLIIFFNNIIYFYINKKMTVINGIEIDDINYKINDIKYAIANNDPIEKKLNLIVVISNPCLFAKRYILLKEFVKRIEEEEENVNLYIVEMIYKNQRFLVTDKKNKNHLQLETETAIWHKENMVNLGVKYLLPKNYKAFAWVDADIEFENSSWAMDTLKILNGCKDVVQLFSHAIDMSNKNTNLNMFNSFGYSFSKNKKYTQTGIDYWHPGYAWAITRKAYVKLGGIYDKGILGSGDNIMVYCLLGHGLDAINAKSTDGYKSSVIQFQNKAKYLRFGYVPGIIRHHYHGTKENRKYNDRWKLLVEYNYTPDMVEGDVLSFREVPQEFRNKIKQYFEDRQEDS